MNKSLRLLFWLTLVGAILTAASYEQALAATAKSKYYAAERCAQQLKKSSSRQKYRDRWLQCIDKYMAAYKHDPRGPWAAAALYQAGSLYSGLSKRSFLKGDKQEAIDLFNRVVNHFPKSRYKPKAQAAKKKLLKGQTTARASSKGPSARDWYKKAQANDSRLQQNVGLQKHRDQWLKSINAYRKAYQADPDGPLAAAALFGQGQSYAGLHRWSHSSQDLNNSKKSFQTLVNKFPQSPYAAKALAVLGTGKAPKAAAVKSGDEIAGIIDTASKPASLPRKISHAASPQQKAIVEGLRFWSNPRYTRVVIDADRDTVFTYHKLREDPAIGKPQRVYIDVHNSRLSHNLQKVMPINDNLLSDARAGQYTSDTVRVVVDIKSAKTYKIFSLKNPFRIVLDVWGFNGEAPAPETPTVAGKNQKLPTNAIVKQLALGVRKIVIDPGHGGKDYGAPGYLKGVHEKKIVLQISKRLAKKISAELNCEVVLTRSGDTYLSLEERTAIANTQDADLFISIHTNASPDKRAYGMETFILNLATDDEAIRVAAMENATSTKNISDLDSILQDLMQNAKVNESTRLASYVQQESLSKLKKKYSHIRSKGVKKAPFYVLLGAQMPSILIETSFISNPRECKRLASPAYQEQLCQGIVNGIKRYIKETHPMAFSRPSAGKQPG